MSQVRSFFQISSSLNHGQRIKVFDSSDEEIEVISSDDDNVIDGSENNIGAGRRGRSKKPSSSSKKKSSSKKGSSKTSGKKSSSSRSRSRSRGRSSRSRSRGRKPSSSSSRSSRSKSREKKPTPSSSSTTVQQSSTTPQKRSSRSRSKSRERKPTSSSSTSQKRSSRSRSKSRERKPMSSSSTPQKRSSRSRSKSRERKPTSSSSTPQKRSSRSRSKSRERKTSQSERRSRSRSRENKQSQSSERLKYKQKKQALKKQYDKELGKATSENKVQLEGRYKEKLESMRQKFKEKRNQAFASGRQDQGQYQQQAQPTIIVTPQQPQYQYGAVPPQAINPMVVPVASSSVPMVQYASSPSSSPLNPMMMTTGSSSIPSEYSYPPSRINWDGASEDEKREILSQLNWSPWVTFPLAIKSLSSSDIERLRQEKEILARAASVSQNPGADPDLKAKAAQYKRLIREIANQRTKNQYDLVSVMKQDPKYANLSDSDIITRARTMSDREQKNFFKKFVKSNSNIGAELIGCHASSFNADEGETVHLFINDPPFERVHAMVKAGGMFQIMPEHSNTDLYQLQGKINAILLFEFFSLVRQLESHFMDSPVDTDTAARSIVVSSAERSVTIVPISSLDLNKKLSSKMTRLWQLFDRILFSIRKENSAQSIGGKRKSVAPVNEIDIVWNTFTEWIPGQKIKERHLLKSASLQLLLDLIYACADITYATKKANKQLLKESEKWFQSLVNQSKQTFSATQTIIQDMLQILHHFIVILPSQFTIEALQMMKNQMIQSKQLTKFKLETSISI